MGDQKKEAKDALGKIIQAVTDEKTQADLILAEKSCIDYYYDIVKTQAVKTITGEGDITDVDIEPIQAAIRKINQACANQKAKFLFKGDINNRKDLFEFAKQVAAPLPE